MREASAPNARLMCRGEDEAEGGAMGMEKVLEEAILVVVVVVVVVVGVLVEVRRREAGADVCECKERENLSRSGRKGDISSFRSWNFSRSRQ